MPTRKRKGRGLKVGAIMKPKGAGRAKKSAARKSKKAGCSNC